VPPASLCRSKAHSMRSLPKFPSVLRSRTAASSSSRRRSWRTLKLTCTFHSPMCVPEFGNLVHVLVRTVGSRGLVAARPGQNQNATFTSLQKSKARWKKEIRLAAIPTGYFSVAARASFRLIPTLSWATLGNLTAKNSRLRRHLRDRNAATWARSPLLGSCASRTLQ